MHFDWTVNLGEVVTWALAVGALCYWSGRLRQKVESIGSDLDSLRTDFREHCDQDVSRFESLNQRLQYLATAKAAAPHDKKG